MRKKKVTENENWQELRENSGLTLSRMAELCGYSVATINGLLVHGKGSARLKESVKALLSENVSRSDSSPILEVVKPPPPPPPPSQISDLPERVAAIEHQLRLLTHAITRLLPPEPKQPALDPLPPAKEYAELRQAEPTLADLENQRPEKRKLLHSGILGALLFTVLAGCTPSWCHKCADRLFACAHSLQPTAYSLQPTAKIRNRPKCKAEVDLISHTAILK